MPDLGGRRILLLEARRSRELAGLVERHGGVPLIAPALEEVPQPEHPSVRRFLDALEAGEIHAVCFLTGVGTQILLAEAERQGRGTVIVSALRRCWVACRGPKPVAVLRAYGIPVAQVAPPPHTTESLIQALRETHEVLQGRTVAVQHHGEPASDLVEALSAMGARVVEVFPYRWALPADLAPLREGLRAVLQGEVAAVCFTSRPQVDHLFEVARRHGQEEALRAALRGPVVVAAVGPVTARALEAAGVPPHVIAPVGTMGRLVKALAEYFHAGEGRPPVSVQ